MSCKDDYQKYKDLTIPSANAWAEWKSAERRAYLAMAAMTSTCIAALLSLGGASPLCVAAISATALATSDAKEKSDKYFIQSDAVLEAFANWLECDVRSRSVPTV